MTEASVHGGVATEDEDWAMEAFSIGAAGLKYDATLLFRYLVRSLFGNFIPRRERHLAELEMNLPKGQGD